jgi:dTDP-4-dehydrorhamnose 3,5-epimerase-like enzyme
MARIIPIKSFNDERGTLTVIQDELPFIVKRIFYIYNSDGSQRGGHRHKKTIQALVCLSGECKIFVNNSIDKEIYILNKHDLCLLLEPEDFHIMYDFINKSTLLVLASEIYNSKDYIHEDYD